MLSDFSENQICSCIKLLFFKEVQFELDVLNNNFFLVIIDALRVQFPQYQLLFQIINVLYIQIFSC